MSRDGLNIPIYVIHYKHPNISKQVTLCKCQNQQLSKAIRTRCSRNSQLSIFMIGYEKRDLSCICIFKHLYLRNHSSYELETWHKHYSIILLHSLWIASSAHFRCGWVSKLVDRIQKLPFNASLRRLTAQDRRLAVASNVGSVKWRAQTEIRSLGLLSPRLWQLEKINGNKSQFSHILSHFFLPRCEHTKQIC